MAERKTGASYLDRPLFTFFRENLSAGTPLILAVLIVCGIGLVYAVLAIFYLLMAFQPDRIVNEPAVEQPSFSKSSEVDSGSDAVGTEKITFNRRDQNHYFRKNSEAGNVLVITGMVRNSYAEARSFIRLRGHLLSSDGHTLADRFVYAGNTLSEEELNTLPIKEILARLSIRGGKDDKNMNIPAGAEIPFMIVFDKLPADMSEYRIDPVGSSPAEGK